jgi:ankyrin repeat protein
MSYWCLSADVLRDLLERGAYDQSGIRKSFLIGSGIHMNCANQESFLDYVNFFLENGVDVNQEDEYGDTALVAASRWGYAEAAKFLLSQGASVPRRALSEAKSDEIRQLLKVAKRGRR